MPASFDRCVKQVKAKGEVKNPHAVCRAAMGTDAEIQKRSKTRERPPAHGKHYGY